MEYKDYYKILGVPRSASDQEIKRAYRRLARKFHPDVSDEPDAERRFKEMKEAYDVLKDAEKREFYDQFGADWKAGQQFQSRPGTGRDFSFQQSGFDQDADLGDLFESIFGGRGGTRQSQSMRMDGDDVNARIAISLEDAFRGTTRQISIDAPEVDRRGRVTHKRRTLNVQIPRGVTAGQRIRLENQGSPGTGSGSQSGDLYLHVEFEPHPVYEARGRDIYIRLPVTPWEAALGQTVKAPTLAGPVDLKIPAGASTGKRLRLKGRGLPGNPPGDEYVELTVVIPKNIDSEARSLYEKLGQVYDFNPRSALGV